MSAAPIRMCVRCDMITDRPVRVREVHGDAGPGWDVYACQDCAPHYPPQPDPIALIDAARARRRHGQEGNR